MQRTRLRKRAYMWEDKIFLQILFDTNIYGSCLVMLKLVGQKAKSDRQPIGQQQGIAASDGEFTKFVNV